MNDDQFRHLIHPNQRDGTGNRGTDGRFEFLTQQLLRIDRLLGEFLIDYDMQKLTEARQLVKNALNAVGELERLAGQVPPTPYDAPPPQRPQQRRRRVESPGPTTPSPPASPPLPSSPMSPPSPPPRPQSL